VILGLVFIAFIVYLAVYEAWAIATHNPTITDHVRDVNKAFVLMPFLAGLIIGGLAVHFIVWF
jgi:hypothetical protein